MTTGHLDLATGVINLSKMFMLRMGNLRMPPCDIENQVKVTNERSCTCVCVPAVLKDIVFLTVEELQFIKENTRWSLTVKSISRSLKNDSIILFVYIWACS